MIGLGSILTKLRRGLTRKESAVDCDIDMAEMENARRDRGKRIDRGLREMQESADALGSLMRDMQSVRFQGRRRR